MSGFTPILFIGIGATSAYYTLRESYLHHEWVGGRDGYMHSEVRSFHHFNLSTDLAEAIAKAEADAENMGLPLKADREQLACDMRAIKRATEDEMERRRAAYAAQQALWTAEREAKRAEQFQQLAEGVVSFGKYNGEKIEDLPRGYLGWLAKKVADFEQASLLRALADVIRDRYAHLLPPEPNPAMLLGEQGQRLTLDVDVIRSHFYERPHAVAHWKMERVYIVTMVTKEGACVVSKSANFYAKEGDKLTIKATVKVHDEYKGQAQTVIQRIKVVSLTL